ncbi:MAG TPA: uroporphyrinogen decarboxylase family protein [Dehalococcoidales bacterium]|nr:uroporphyrinogen decarboxylase family protein [Dehalococcoidales bacterium]
MVEQKKWDEMTPAQKREIRFKKWLNPPGVEFVSRKAEENYKARVQRLIDAIKLKEPDRVPVNLPAGFFPAFYSGGSLEKSMYNYAEMERSWKKYIRDFDGDTSTSPGLVFPAKMLEIIGHNFHKWPGHGLPSDGAIYQFIEAEYMKAEDYAQLIRDPSDFWMRNFLPKVAKVFEPFQNLPPLTAMMGIPMGYVGAFANPELQEAYKTLFKASREVVKWGAAVQRINQYALSHGFPSFSGSMSGAPFDMIADMHRGTNGSIMDMYRRPEVLIESLERITPIAIKSALDAARNTLCPLVQMPLHKGDDVFMSDKQFEKFYWPTFKRILNALIDDGLVPVPFAEGSYMRRLDYIKDMRKGTIIWWFERVDMAKAKQVLGGRACIAGNIPVSVMLTGTPQDVKAACRRLIETCAPGGGYILTGAASMNKGSPANLHAVMEAAREYGTYKR